MRNLITLAISVALGLASVTTAAPITLHVDDTQSAVDVELCITALVTVCDAGNSPVAGFIDLDVPCPLAPTTVSVHDFVFDITQNVDLLINHPFGGQLNASAQNVVISYALPGTPLPPTLLVADTFSYVGVPVSATGHLVYWATGAICDGLTLAGMPCGSSGDPVVLDLSTFVLDPLELSATLTFPNDRVMVASDLSVGGPLLDTLPGLGTFSANGAILADAPLPLTCCNVDMTGGDTVNLTDHHLFGECMAGPGVPVIGGCGCADIDGDGDVDFEDFAAFQVALSSR